MGVDRDPMKKKEKDESSTSFPLSDSSTTTIEKDMGLYPCLGYSTEEITRPDLASLGLRWVSEVSFDVDRQNTG